MPNSELQEPGNNQGHANSEYLTQESDYDEWNPLGTYTANERLEISIESNPAYRTREIVQNFQENLALACSQPPKPDDNSYYTSYNESNPQKPVQDKWIMATTGREGRQITTENSPAYGIAHNLHKEPCFKPQEPSNNQMYNNSPLSSCEALEPAYDEWKSFGTVSEGLKISTESNPAYRTGKIVQNSEENIQISHSKLQQLDDDEEYTYYDEFMSKPQEPVYDEWNSLGTVREGVKISTESNPAYGKGGMQNSQEDNQKPQEYFDDQEYYVNDNEFVSKPSEPAYNEWNPIATVSEGLEISTESNPAYTKSGIARGSQKSNQKPQELNEDQEYVNDDEFMSNPQEPAYDEWNGTVREGLKISTESNPAYGKGRAMEDSHKSNPKPKEPYDDQEYVNNDEFVLPHSELDQPVNNTKKTAHTSGEGLKGTWGEKETSEDTWHEYVNFDLPDSKPEYDCVEAWL